MLSFLKYIGSIIVFFLIYIICSALAYLGVWFINRDMNVWILPYFVGPVAGILGVLGALHVVERLFPNIQLRIVAWVFVGFIGIGYGIPLFGLFLGAIGAIDAPLTSHTLWSPDAPPQILHGLTAAVAAWYMTRRDGVFDS